MNGTETGRTESAGAIIGWLIVAASIAQLPPLMISLMVLRILPSAGTTLLLATQLSLCLLLLAGGIGLIYRRMFGYYCVYAVTFFGGVGGFKNPYVPLLKRWINVGPATEDLFLVLNLLLTAILIWEHWNRLGSLEVSLQRLHRGAIIILASVGLVWASVGHALTHRERGEKNQAADLPVVGASLGQFVTTGKIAYVSVQTRLPRGITLVCSGSTSELDVEQLAVSHHLQKINQSAAQKKFLPQAKAWKLEEGTFPTKFASDDLFFAGRLKGMPKVTFQMVFRTSDGTFVAQFFGIPSET